MSFITAAASSLVGRLPRPLNVTYDRSLLFGAYTP